MIIRPKLLQIALKTENYFKKYESDSKKKHKETCTKNRKKRKVKKKSKK